MSEPLSLIGKEILIVDDAPDFLLFTRKILEAQGAVVHQAVSFEEAISQTVATCPHLVITDLNMPDKSGFDLISALKKNNETSNIPVIALSALNDPQSIFKAVSFGACDYLLKPFNANLFIQKIHKSLKLSQFQIYVFPKETRPKATLSINADIVMCNEIGIILESAVKFAPNEELVLESPSLGFSGFESLTAKSTSQAPRFSSRGKYLTELNLIGLDEILAKKLTRLLKGVA